MTADDYYICINICISLYLKNISKLRTGTSGSDSICRTMIVLFGFTLPADNLRLGNLQILFIKDGFICVVVKHC